MFMKNIISIFVLILFLLSSLIADDLLTQDSFTELKSDLKSAGCIQIKFISVLESDVFDTIDSTMGDAIISKDGRYRIMLGTDLYLYDLQKSYSYSEETNQVIIEKVDDPEMVGNEISFIRNIDDLYNTIRTLDKNIFKLIRIRNDNDFSDIPDSMMIFISNNDHFDSLSFYDASDDLNYIYFINQDITDSCDNLNFIPEFPDSVERVRFSKIL